MKVRYNVDKKISLKSGFIKVEYKFRDDKEFFKFKEDVNSNQNIASDEAPLCNFMGCEFKCASSGCTIRGLDICSIDSFINYKLYSYIKLNSLFSASKFRYNNRF